MADIAAAIATLRDADAAPSARDAAFAELKAQFIRFYSSLKTKFAVTLAHVYGSYELYMDEALYETATNDTYVVKDGTNYILRALKNKVIDGIRSYYKEVEHFKLAGEEFFMEQPSHTANLYEWGEIIAEMHSKLQGVDAEIFDKLLAGVPRTDLITEYTRYQYELSKKRIEKAVREIVRQN